jgi:hypothetical protein
MGKKSDHWLTTTLNCAWHSAERGMELVFQLKHEKFADTTNFEPGRQHETVN